MMDLDKMKAKICIMAASHGWYHLKTQEWCINFYKNYSEDRAVINVYWSGKTLVTMGFREPSFTVQTAINHPKKGKTQLNRRDVPLGKLADILENPRKHTGKGYYKTN
jgi:hypothetical protein